MKNALAILIQQKNDAQKKLVVDTPAMLNCLSLMIENEIGSDSTQALLNSFGNGYVKYGRLTDKQLVVLKNSILQYAGEILAIGSHTESTESSESHEDDSDEDPFAS